MPRFRLLLATVALVLSIVALALAIGYKYLEVDTRWRFHTLVYTELTKSGIDLNTGESDKFFDVTLVLLGTLAGLVLAKPKEAKMTLEDKPELLMFISAVMLLISSSICHMLYLSAVSDVCFKAKTDRLITQVTPGSEPNPDWKPETVLTPVPSGPQYVVETQLTLQDVRDPGVEYLLRGQTWFLVFGFILVCMVLVSANLLKETD
jgi:hypothetical protein